MNDAAHWDRRAATYDDLAWVRRGDLLSWTADLVDRSVPALVDGDGELLPVLEVGVGTGALTVELAKRGRRVVGVDVSQAMLDRCAARLADAGLRADLRFVRPSGDLPPGPYAAVVSRMVLHHATWHPAFQVAAWRSQVAPGGTIVVAEGPPPHVDDRHDACHLYRAAMALKEPGRHVFHAHDVAQWLFDAGCDEVASHERWTDGNSVRGWLDGGGVDADRARAILALHREAPERARVLYKIEERDGDVLMRWRHCVVAGRVPA